MNKHDVAVSVGREHVLREDTVVGHRFGQLVDRRSQVHAIDRVGKRRGIVHVGRADHVGLGAVSRDDRGQVPVVPRVLRRDDDRIRILDFDGDLGRFHLEHFAIEQVALRIVGVGFDGVAVGYVGGACRHSPTHLRVAGHDHHRSQRKTGRAQFARVQAVFIGEPAVDPAVWVGQQDRAAGGRAPGHDGPDVRGPAGSRGCR
jgi:hypothetical protein